MAPRSCKGCGSTTRALSKPGPRCASCWRAEVTRRREASWARHLWETFRMTPERYWKILAAQGGVCAWCRRAKGLRKRLAVDHDHACCRTTPTCGKCSRMLLCSRCNSTFGHFRDDPETIRRGADLLENWPSRRVNDGEGAAGQAV